MTAADRTRERELRRLLTVVVLPLIDKLCCYADAPTRQRLHVVRCELTAIWQATNTKLLAESEG